MEQVKKKRPTQSQFLDLWQTATELGLDREMVETMKPEITALMKKRKDEITADRENCLTFELTATVQQDRPYIEALEAAAPDTPGSYNARKVENLHPPVSQEKEEVEFILRNFPKGGGGWDKAQEWAKAKGYKPTNPREGFAVVEQHDLRKLLDRSWLYLVTTTDCSFGGYRQAVYVYVDESFRGADLDWLGDFGGGCVWFLFRK